MCSLSFRSSGATEQNQNEFKIFGFGSVFPPIIFKFSIELRVIFDSNELRLRFFNLPPPSLFSVCFRLIRLSYRPLYIFFQFFASLSWFSIGCQRIHLIFYWLAEDTPEFLLVGRGYTWFLLVGRGNTWFFPIGWQRKHLIFYWLEEDTVHMIFPYCLAEDTPDLLLVGRSGRGPWPQLTSSQPRRMEKMKNKS